MIDQALRDPFRPTRPEGVEERHFAVEQYRRTLLQCAANFRFAAAQFEVMIEHAPDHDHIINDWSEKTVGTWNDLASCLTRYRSVRDIKGIA